MKKDFKLCYWAGAIIPLWLLVGVTIASSFYPGYDHVRQALSELGAVGSPVHRLSPAINNFPIGILCLLFALGLWRSAGKSNLIGVTALLVAIHGLGSIGAGLYSCDPGCRPPQPSASQIIHNLSGLAMCLSLLAANSLWVARGKRFGVSANFHKLSLLALIITLVTLPLMGASIQWGLFGVFQRINYGTQVIWLMGLALQLMTTQRRSLLNR